MKKILFICLGNICRSCTAQFVFKDMAVKKGVAEHYEVDSAALSSEESGNPIYPEALHTLEAHGIVGARHHSRQITAADYEYYDMLVVMDHQNLRSIQRRFSQDGGSKISLLLDHAPNADHRDIADPWYTRDFETAFRDISIGCKGLLSELEK